MSSLMDGDQRSAHCGRRSQNKIKNSRPRNLHQGTLNLGDTTPCYTTTHTQSYSGESAEGRPLVFHLRDPSCPSQCQTRLDLSTNTVQCPLTKERTDPKVENWARHRSGQAVKEITNPQDPSEYWTTYKSKHSLPVTDGSPRLAGGRPTQWHQHNILTGEQKPTAGPGRPSRRSRDKLLWEERLWETDCCALRLY